VRGRRGEIPFASPELTSQEFLHRRSERQGGRKREARANAFVRLNKNNKFFKKDDAEESENDAKAKRLACVYIKTIRSLIDRDGEEGKGRILITIARCRVQ
jgi:hypothetical protein